MKMVIVYGYLVFIPLSIVSTLIYSYKYEKYKRKMGYRNKYKGGYKFKNFFCGNALKQAVDYFIKFFVPGFQLESIIDLLLFKSSAKVDFYLEELSGEIEFNDPKVIDGDFKIISEERITNDKKQASTSEIEEEQTEAIVYQLEHLLSLDTVDEQKIKYNMVVDEYVGLYEECCSETKNHASVDVSSLEENRGLRLK